MTYTRFEDITGRTFNEYTVLRCLSGPPFKAKTLWECRCSCGTVKPMIASVLRYGSIKSCGCLFLKWSRSDRKHGATQTPEYRSWASAKARCFNQSKGHWGRYGGRGITMCDRWANDFRAFLADMGPRPGNHELDRIDNNGNYEPGNCRWVDRFAQMSNRNVTRYVEYEGQRMSVAQCARKYGIGYGLLYTRLSGGWSIHDAINTPRIDKYVHPH